MDDIFGNALLDFYHGKHSEELLTETSISEAEEMPLSYLFRSYSEMPPIEQRALKLAKGRVLDVGCGAGSHSLYLQNKGLDVTAIDISSGAVEVAKLRGVETVSKVNLLDFTGRKFDTVLLLMNGAGIFQTLDKLPKYLEHLKSMLDPGGQVLVDSSDLIYMYDRTKEGGVWVPGDKYYGEIEYTIGYKGAVSEPFEWLYLAEDLLAALATEAGFKFELVQRGDHYDYLARLSIP